MNSQAIPMKSHRIPRNSQSILSNSQTIPRNCHEVSKNSMEHIFYYKMYAKIFEIETKYLKNASTNKLITYLLPYYMYNCIYIQTQGISAVFVGFNYIDFNKYNHIRMINFKFSATTHILLPYI